MAKRLLVGLHKETNIDKEIFNRVTKRLIGKIAAEKGYQDPVFVYSQDEMLEQMGVPPQSTPDYPAPNHFDTYLMEANLNASDGEDITPILGIQLHIQTTIENGTTRLIGMSGGNAVVYAQEAGINCISKPFTIQDLSDIL